MINYDSAGCCSVALVKAEEAFPLSYDFECAKVAMITESISFHCQAHPDEL